MPLIQSQSSHRDHVYHVLQGPGGTLLSNGSWTGIMGELTSGRADLALFPLTLTTQRAQYIQHTQPYMDEGYGLLVRTGSVDPGYSFLMPFETFTWVMLILALFLTICIIFVLDSISRSARLKAIERTHGHIKLQTVRKRDKLMGHAIETVMMAVGSGSTPTTRSCSVKVMFVSWAIFCVIMLSAYTANLTANLTVNQMASAIKSLSDLKESSLPFGVPAQSSISSYFSNSSDQAARALHAKMMEFRVPDEAVEAVRDGKIAAYISDYPTVQYYTQVPPCDLALGSDTIGSGALVIGLSPNSTIRQKLDAALLQLSEAGYLAELRRKWFVEASRCSLQDSDASGKGRLSVHQAWSVFLVLAGGAAIAVVVALLEVIYYKRFFSGVQELKKEMSEHGPRHMLRKSMGRRYQKTSSSMSNRSLTSDRSINTNNSAALPDIENADASESNFSRDCTAEIYGSPGNKDAERH
eukprot:GHUV01053208.1.p1 GENE.GHUV01053208.1~~GHUV01053208.1.p1  ORF type:complete len:468 (+),score=104.28 GHUV01053208.1:524-1927(+)